MSAGSIAERGAFADFVSPIDLDLQPLHVMFHGGLHILGAPFEIRVERIDRARPFVSADAVEHLAGRRDQRAAVETCRGLDMDPVGAAELAPAGQQVIRHFRERRGFRADLPEGAEHHHIAQPGAPGVIEQPVHEPVAVVRDDRHVIADRDFRRLVLQRIDSVDGPLGGVGRNGHIDPGLGEAESELVPAGFQLEFQTPVLPADDGPVRAGGENFADERLARQSPRRERKFQMVVFRLLQHQARDQQEKPRVAVFQLEMMFAGNGGEPEPDIFQQLHVGVVLAEIVDAFRDRFAVAEHGQREIIVHLFFVTGRIFRGGHGDHMQDRFVAVTVRFGQFRLESGFRSGRDPGRAHPRPVTHGDGIGSKLVRFQDGLSRTRRRPEPVISRAGHDHMAAEIFRADRKFDPAFGEDLLRLELERPGKRNEFEDGFFGHFSLDPDPREPAASRAFPARGIEQGLPRTMSRAIPDDRIIQLKNVLDGAVRTFQMSVPMVERVIMAPGIQVLITPVYAEIQFHVLTSRSMDRCQKPARLVDFSFPVLPRAASVCPDTMRNGNNITPNSDKSSLSKTGSSGEKRVLRKKKNVCTA